MPKDFLSTKYGIIKTSSDVNQIGDTLDLKITTTDKKDVYDVSIVDNRIDMKHNYSGSFIADERKHSIVPFIITIPLVWGGEILDGGRGYILPIIAVTVVVACIFEIPYQIIKRSQRFTSGRIRMEIK